MNTSLPYPIDNGKSIYLSICISVGLTLFCVSAAGLIMLLLFHKLHSYHHAPLFFFIICFLLGALLLFGGVKRFRYYARFYRYIDIIGTRNYIAIPELAQASNEPTLDTLHHVKRYLSDGRLPEAYIDFQEMILFLTEQKNCHTQ